ncbi:MAG TPA: hypothetical protein VLA89_04725 [Gemmatimonadales bacterium]|nr:hypothetical protein [Gemmatimonadales bacterium]
MSIVTVVMSVALYRFSLTVADPDLWGHIKFGQTIWKAGRVAMPDPFSYLTAGRPWLDHEWLSEVIFYLVFAAAGPAGLTVMKALLGVGLMAILYRHLCRQGISVLRTGFLVVATVHFFLISLITVRTLIFSYPLFLVVLLLLHQMAQGRPRWLWIVPPLFALWANLHPAFLAGLGIIGIWAIVELWARVVDRRSALIGRPTIREIIILPIACGLATILNPFGFTLWSFLLETAFGSRPDITEWQPVVLMTRVGLAYAAFVALALWGLINSRRPQRASLMAVLVVMVLLPLVAIRHTPLAALAVTVIAGEHIADAWDRWVSNRSASRSGSRLAETWFSGAALVAALLLVTSALPRFSCIRIAPVIGGSYPARAVALIKESGVAGNLAIDFDWGEYALYHLSPAVKVSMDGRRETAYSRRIYLETLAFRFGQGKWNAVLENPETHMALVKTGLATFNLMKLEPGWRLIYQDSLAAMFAREGHPIVDVLERTPAPSLPSDGAGLCVP